MFEKTHGTLFPIYLYMSGSYTLFWGQVDQWNVTSSADQVKVTRFDYQKCKTLVYVCAHV